MAKKFKAFDRSEVERARAELMKRFSVEAKKLGLEIDLGRITYDTDKFRGKLTVTIANKNPVAPVTGLMPITGMPKIGQTFLHRGTVFTITRFKLSNHKYPVIAQNARGTVYKWSIEQVNEGS